MSGKNPRLNPLTLQKKLLIAESELNRAQLVQEWQTMTDETHALANQARTLRSLASAAAVLINGVASLRCKNSAPASEKPSWLTTILKGAGLVSKFWAAFRSPDRSKKDT
jgi:hypothetical protein